MLEQARGARLAEFVKQRLDDIGRERAFPRGGPVDRSAAQAPSASAAIINKGMWQARVWRSTGGLYATAGAANNDRGARLRGSVDTETAACQGRRRASHG